jgi:hypothetical protein
MFGTRHDEETGNRTPREPAAAAEPPREKRPARESECFKPSTFASRKAANEADGRYRGQRLASLGPTEFTQKNPRNGQTEYLDAELFVDIDHPAKRYIAISGVPGLHPIGSSISDERRDEKTPLPPTFGRRLGGPRETDSETPADRVRPI